MDKKPSFFLRFIGFCFVLGAILCFIGIALGGRPISIKQEETKVTNNSVSFDSLDTTSIKSLNFNVSACDFNIVTGEKFEIDGGKLKRNEIKDGTWYLEIAPDYHDVEIFGYTFKFPFIPFDKESLKGRHYTITIPVDYHFENADITFGAADVEIDLLQADNIHISGGAGDCDVKMLQAPTFDSKIGAGTINIVTYIISESANIKCGAGEFILGEEVAANTCNNLTAKSGAGSLKVAGKLTGDSKIESSTGEAEFDLYGKRENYDIHWTTVMGSTNIEDNDEVENPSDSNEVGLIYGSIDLDCSMGEIDIDFED